MVRAYDLYSATAQFRYCAVGVLELKSYVLSAQNYSVGQSKGMSDDSNISYE